MCESRKGCDQILQLRHNPLPSNKQDTICCHWALPWLDGGVKGTGCPGAVRRAIWNHRLDRADSAQGHSGHFIGCPSNVAFKLITTPVAYKSTPTFDFDGGVGWRRHLKCVDTHVDSCVVRSWFNQPVEHKPVLQYKKATLKWCGFRLPLRIWELPVFSVLIWAACFWDLLSILHPVAL